MGSDSGSDRWVEVGEEGVNDFENECENLKGGDDGMMDVIQLGILYIYWRGKGGIWDD